MGSGAARVGGRWCETVGFGIFVQRLLHRLSSPVETRHHGTDWNVEHLGDLLLGEALHIGEQHRKPE
jgi:hypothetical protein